MSVNEILPPVCLISISEDWVGWGKISPYVAQADHMMSLPRSPRCRDKRQETPCSTFCLLRFLLATVHCTLESSFFKKVNSVSLWINTSVMMYFILNEFASHGVQCNCYNMSALNVYTLGLRMTQYPLLLNHIF